MNNNNMNNLNLNNLFQSLNSNPMFQRAQEMAQGKSKDDIMAIAQNICKEKGINFEEAWAAFQNQMKGR